MIGGCALFGGGRQTDINRIVVPEFGRSQIEQFGIVVQHPLRRCSALRRWLCAYNWRL